jgi:hypothetical protein
MSRSRAGATAKMSVSVVDNCQSWTYPVAGGCGTGQGIAADIAYEVARRPASSAWTAASSTPQARWGFRRLPDRTCG